MGSQLPIPSYDDLFEPTIKALKALGGSGTIQEILTRQYKSQKGIQKFQGFQPKKCQINYCRFNI